MKSIIRLCVIILVFSNYNYGLINPLERIKNLVGGQWEINGKWGDGTEFNQEVFYEWGLNKKILKVKTYGTVNIETGEHGLRNEGIRAFDETNNKIIFWEFDVFGGIVEGEVLTENKDIFFNYDYKVDGTVYSMSDKWEFVTKDKYIFKVRMKKNGKYEELLVSEIIRK